MSIHVKIVGGSILILMFICLGFGFIVIREKIESRKEDQLVLSELSVKLGVRPGWVNVREHVFCRMLQPGMTPEEVNQVLSLVGDYTGSEPPDQEIHFTNRYIGRVLSPLFLIYNQKDGGLKGLGVNEYNGGPRSSCEDEWMERWISPD